MCSAATRCTRGMTSCAWSAPLRLTGQRCWSPAAARPASPFHPSVCIVAPGSTATGIPSIRRAAATAVTRFSRRRPLARPFFAVAATTRDVFARAAPRARFRSATGGFLDGKLAGQSSTTRSYPGAAQLVPPHPSRFVATHAPDGVTALGLGQKPVVPFIERARVIDARGLADLFHGTKISRTRTCVTGMPHLQYVPVIMVGGPAVSDRIGRRESGSSLEPGCHGDQQPSQRMLSSCIDIAWEREVPVPSSGVKRPQPRGDALLV